MSDSWTSATPLRNADFKALLTTPRPAHLQQQNKDSSSTFKHPRPKGSVDGNSKDKGFKKPPAKLRPAKAVKAGEKSKEGEDGPMYRDRAKERRDGLNVDFADAEQEMAARGLGPQALQRLSIEQSKFLGGDISHTHLVKGLDYALLHQNRQKLESGGSTGSSTASAVAAAAAAAAVAEATAEAAREQHALQFATAQGRALYNAVFRPPASNRVLVREMFQPRRTAFVFEFGEGCSDVPTTLRRSKADCPPVQDVVSAAADANLLDRISKIMSYINQTASKTGKRSVRDSQYIRSILAGVNPAAPGDGQVHGQLVMKGQAAIAPSAASSGLGSAAASAAAGEDDDIFGDAGTDYTPALPQKKGDSRRAEGLFENQDHQADLQQQPAAAGGDEGDVDMDIEEGELQAANRLPPPPPEQQQEQQQHVQGYPGYYPADSTGDYYQQQQAGWQQDGWQQQQQYGQQQYGQPATELPKWRVPSKPGATSASQQGFADEAYAECFPSMADYGVVDDDEEDPKKAKAAAAAAAAAAGEKGQGEKGPGKGGRGGGLDDMERKLKQKLSREVHQMQGIFKEKGWGSEAAFKKEDRLDAVAATPARKRLRI